MSAHRYWRILVNTIQSGAYVSIVEMEMFETASTTDATGSGTAAANSTYTAEGATPAKAFDNVLTYPGWTNNGDGAGCWLAYDFGSGVAKDIAAVSLLNRNDSWYFQIPSNFSIQYSDDASSWTTLFSVLGLTWSRGQRRYFTASGELSAEDFAALSDDPAKEYVKKIVSYAVFGGTTQAEVIKALGYAVFGGTTQAEVIKVMGYAVLIAASAKRPTVFAAT